MPSYPDFQPSTVGLQVNQAAASLMDRVRQRRFQEEKFKQDKAKFAMDVATNDVELQQRKFEFETGKAKFKEFQDGADLRLAQRTAETDRLSRATVVQRDWAAKMAEFDSDVELIRGHNDPAIRRSAAANLQIKYGRFSTFPEAADHMATSISGLAGQTAALAASKVRAVKAEGGYDSLAEANVAAPGYLKILHRDDFGNVAVSVDRSQPDADMDRRAMQVLDSILTAELTPGKDGEPSAGPDLAKAFSDPDVQVMRGVAGSQTAKALEEYRRQQNSERAMSRTLATFQAKRDMAPGLARIPQGLGEKVTKVVRAWGMLNDIDAQSEIIGASRGPVLGRIRSLNPYDMDAAKLNSMITAAIPITARGVFAEVGVLTDQDVALYRQLFPSIKSPEDIASVMTTILRRRIQEAYTTEMTFIKGQNYITTGLPDSLETPSAQQPSTRSMSVGDLSK